MDDQDEPCFYTTDSNYEYVPCFLSRKFTLVSIALLACACGVLLFLCIDNQNNVHHLRNELQATHVQQYTLEGGMRPQFYTHNRSGDWSVPTGIIMPVDGRMFSRSTCTFSENTRTAEVLVIVQTNAEISSNQLHNLVEFRFEVPYGLPIGVAPGTTTTYSRCPAPVCGTSDYRIGIGANNGFQDAESSFFSTGQVIQNRTLVAPTPIECGCSNEVPARMSCSFFGSHLLPIDGPLAIIGRISYVTANLTVPV